MDRKRLGAIYKKTLGHCWYCGEFLEPFSGWQVDHQDPRSQGGSDSLDNLVAACQRCNLRKSNRSVSGYEKYLIARLENLITGAEEFAQELCGPNITEVQAKLHEAAELVVYGSLCFWGDQTLDDVPDNTVDEQKPQHAEAVQ